MFETVGKDDSRARRRWVPLLLSIALNGALGGAIVWAGTRVAAEPAHAEDRIEAYIELVSPAAPAGPKAPAAGPSRAAPRRAAPEVAAVVPVVAAPVVPPPDVADAGDDGGVVADGGDAGPGGTGGPGGGPDGGPGGGGGTGDGIRVVHWSDVVVLKRSTPGFPDAAKRMGVREGTCVVRIQIDRDGVPTAVEPQACPAVFEIETVKAARAWRFVAPERDGVRIAAQFDLKVNYSRN